MAHEILENDNVVLHREGAWHGLGTIVQDAPTPHEALKIARLDWTVEQWPLSATNGEVRVALGDHVANIRSDTKGLLGLVTTGYTPVQNVDLAEFCTVLAEQGDVVKVESAGSIRNGQKVWFLLKGESFSVRGKDEVRPYICVSNGHDGKTAIRCTPTSVRVVCSNTLHLVIPRNEGKETFRVKAEGFCSNHIGDVADKIEQAKQALQLYGRSLETTKGLIDRLAAKEVNREEVQRFFLECYTRDFGAIPTEPKTAAEERAATKAKDAFNAFAKRFDEEKGLAGTTAWNALNAYTGYVQNDRTFWKDPAKDAERRVSGQLFGDAAESGVKSLELALAI